MQWSTGHGITGGPFTQDDCRKSSERLNYLGKVCRDNGLVLCWHNHNKEFAAMETGTSFRLSYGQYR